MDADIPSLSPEGEPFRCPVCGTGDRGGLSRDSGDASCPACGRWLRLSPEVVHGPAHRMDPTQVGRYLQASRRRPMFGVRATISRGLEWVVRAARRRSADAADPEPVGIYDHWLDG